MKHFTLLVILLCATLFSCTRRTTTTTIDPNTGQQVTTTTIDNEPITAAAYQPAYNGSTDWYGNQDYGYGGFWDSYGHYIFFSGPNYQYMRYGHPYFYHVSPGISIYQPPIRTYGYSHQTNIIVNGRTVTRTIQTPSVGSAQFRSPAGSQQSNGRINTGGNGSVIRSNGNLSVGTPRTVAPPISRPTPLSRPVTSTPRTSLSSPSRSSISTGRRR